MKAPTHNIKTVFFVFCNHRKQKKSLWIFLMLKSNYIESTQNVNKNSDTDMLGTHVSVETLLNDRPDFLGVLDPKDVKWTLYKRSTIKLSNILHIAPKSWGYAPKAFNLQHCADQLDFAFRECQDDPTRLKLFLMTATFCRERGCAICTWRKSMRWQALMFRAESDFKKHHPRGRWLFLTLTIANPKIQDLRETLRILHQSFGRFMRYKRINDSVISGIRFTEITRPKKQPNTHAHPHLHVALYVGEKYFVGRNYIKHSEWQELWQKAIGVDYCPQVHVRTIKSRQKKDGSTVDAYTAMVLETVKYSTEFDDLIGDGNLDSNRWVYEYFRQIKGMRFVSPFGMAKKILAELDDDVSNDDMIHTELEQETETPTADNMTLEQAEQMLEKCMEKSDEEPRVTFDWHCREWAYFLRTS